MIDKSFVDFFELIRNKSNTNPSAQVLEWHQQGLDFADAFHLAQSQHCGQLYTFDRKFLRKAKNLTECEVKQPELF